MTGTKLHYAPPFSCLYPGSPLRWVAWALFIYTLILYKTTTQRRGRKTLQPMDGGVQKCFSVEVSKLWMYLAQYQSVTSASCQCGAKPDQSTILVWDKFSAYKMLCALQCDLWPGSMGEPVQINSMRICNKFLISGISLFQITWKFVEHNTAKLKVLLYRKFCYIRLVL